MQFDSRVFRLPRDLEHPEQYEDALAVDGRRAVAAIADGVAAAIFSRQWAEILTRAAVLDPPDPSDRPTFARWLGRQRQLWQQGIDPQSLAWFQKAKLREGAFSTLLCARLVSDEAAGASAETCRVRGFAFGDSCLFHVRQGEILRTFPAHTSAAMQEDPAVLGSVDLNRDGQLPFHTLDEPCREDDLLVLCTDAIALWALTRLEADDPPDWRRYWDLSEDDWTGEIVTLRERGAMRYDDSTLALLRVTQQAVTSCETPASVALPEAGAAPEEPAETSASAGVQLVDAPDPPRREQPASPGDSQQPIADSLGKALDWIGEQSSHGLRKVTDLYRRWRNKR